MRLRSLGAWLKDDNSRHPLVTVVVAFFLTTILGTVLTYCSNVKQAELQRERSRADEFLKIRLNKTSEVWEKIYLYEAAVEDVMEAVDVSVREGDSAATPHVVIGVPPGSDFETLSERTKSLYDQVREVLNKNRFWLSDKNHDGIKRYAEETYDYYLTITSKSTNKDQRLKATQKRSQARDELIRIRDEMLKE